MQRLAKTDRLVKSVSILYEVPRVCNRWGRRTPHGDGLFQSSTRFLEFATHTGRRPPLWERFNPLRGSSSLQRTPSARHCFRISRFQSSTRFLEFATPARGSRGGRENGFQSSTRFLEFATSGTRFIRAGNWGVSILYEVPRVCNAKSSIEWTDSTWVSILYEVPRVCNRHQPQRPARARGVSILYEVPRVCNIRVLQWRNDNGKSFNPLRGSSSLQPGSRGGQTDNLYVSILYEVPRVCNFVQGVDCIAPFYVSILYEVPRVCNFSGISREQIAALSFNPLRGSSSLQRAFTVKQIPGIEVSILYEVPRVCNYFPFHGRHAPWCFNPLRGSSSLQR